uniref:Uncharacterized protein n=1 Tax=Percolomonas cosmopolitus TaxID=63605 RepID=A0A7S1PK14_9EUKA|eukprot:CAMPEP_0117450298 /NCGR_PEP_ID=MMETSP0759-20121206/8393_1 /TAXON_ID=63605 /ORGANISM="Percolomonas cosmopolitus, Strain WS" /LENGTH=111 /DNA_ID=CAMNT_0005242809 /DNA_START=42 /DNA_END=377 /DNA_ORIENTATION=-
MSSTAKLAASKASGSIKGVLRALTTLPNGKSITHYMSPYSGYIYLLKHPNRYIKYLTIPYCAVVFGSPGYIGLSILNSNKEKSEKIENEKKQKIIRTMDIEKDLRHAEEQA